MEIVKLDNILKKLKKIPNHIHINLQSWVASVELGGIREVRKIPGYHDEPLKGKRKRQRSIRLSKHWRAIYREERRNAKN